MHSEVWYEIQYSVKDADDWFTLGGKSNYDTFESASKAATAKWRDRAGDFDIRVAKKTLTEEPFAKVSGTV